MTKKQRSASISDVDAQCLVDDGEGNIFLCPLYLRNDARTHFEAVYEAMSDPEYIPPPLPAYLIPVTGLDRLYFFKAVVE